MTNSMPVICHILRDFTLVNSALPKNCLALLRTLRCWAVLRLALYDLSDETHSMQAGAYVRSIRPAIPWPAAQCTSTSLGHETAIRETAAGRDIPSHQRIQRRNNTNRFHKQKLVTACLHSHSRATASPTGTVIARRSDTTQPFHSFAVARPVRQDRQPAIRNENNKLLSQSKTHSRVLCK